MKNIKKTNQEKEALVAEYLLGEKSYRQLGKQHGVDFRLLHSWVTKFQGKEMRTTNPKTIVKLTSTEPLSTQLKQLQEELRKAKLHAELLNTIIDIAEDQLKINIRKKYGTKR